MSGLVLAVGISAAFALCIWRDKLDIGLVAAPLGLLAGALVGALRRV